MSDATADALEREIEESAKSQWEFWDSPPTVDEVRQLLEQLPPVYGVKTVDYLDYVQALPQSKKVGGLRDERGRKGPVENRDTWSLYMSVGGRIKMLQAAAELNGWEVDLRPEMHVPDGCPVGFLEFGERIVYREYCVITQFGVPTDDSPWAVRVNQMPIVLGSRPGTAWVPRSGGSQAKGSNPYEKVETAARGRAIAAWGFGVLPGSGIASLEEMQGVAENRRAMDDTDPADRAGGTRKSRNELLQETLLNSEKIRELTGFDEAKQRGAIVEYLQNKLGIHEALITDDDQIDWSKVKDGQLAMLNRQFKTRLAAAAAAGEMT